MEAVSLGVKDAGGHCVGITLAAFETKRPQNPHLGEKQVAADLFERVAALISGSELFVVQHGSLGTLNELFLVWTLKYAGLAEGIRIVLLGTRWRQLEMLAPLIQQEQLGLIERYDSLEAWQDKGGI